MRYPPTPPISAMFTMFSPSAVSPPSAIIACTTRTREMTMYPAQGPTRTAARTPPSRCPLIPGNTGKLTN